MGKFFKNIGLIFFGFSIACVVSKWGDEFIKNPILIFAALLLVATVCAIAYCFNER